MGASPERIASAWREQMKRGYLKLATLFTLTREPLHGYKVMKRIHEMSLGAITPTAGGIYPVLRELEGEGLIKGEWRSGERRRVYEITEKGINVFRIAVERHFELAHSIRNWMLKELSRLRIIDVESPEPSSTFAPAARILLLHEESSPEERIKAFIELKKKIEGLIHILNRMIRNIDSRVEELRLKS